MTTLNVDLNRVSEYDLQEVVSPADAKRAVLVDDNSGATRAPQGVQQHNGYGVYVPKPNGDDAHEDFPQLSRASGSNQYDVVVGQRTSNGGHHYVAPGQALV